MLTCRSGFAQTGCDYTIYSYNDVWDADLQNPPPSGGAIVCIDNGNRNELTIRNLEGTDTSPIIIKPYGGLVTISPSNGTIMFCIKFENCKYFTLTGTGITGYEYGIKLDLDGGDDNAVGINTNPLLNNYGGSTDFTIENIEIYGDGYDNNFGGIASAPHPDESDETTWGEYNTVPPSTPAVGFTLRNVIIENNYIHNIGGEAIRVGEDLWEYKYTTSISGVDYEYEVPQVEGVKVFNNRLEYIVD